MCLAGYKFNLPYSGLNLLRLEANGLSSSTQCLLVNLRTLPDVSQGVRRIRSVDLDTLRSAVHLCHLHDMWLSAYFPICTIDEHTQLAYSLGGCLSQLLLCNKLPHNLMAYKCNIYFSLNSLILSKPVTESSSVLHSMGHLED